MAMASFSPNRLVEMPSCYLPVEAQAVHGIRNKVPSQVCRHFNFKVIIPVKPCIVPVHLRDKDNILAAVELPVVYVAHIPQYPCKEVSAVCAVDYWDFSDVACIDEKALIGLYPPIFSVCPVN